LALIGGLVSALVIGELAITKPSQTPIARAVSSTTSPTESTILKVATFA